MDIDIEYEEEERENKLKCPECQIQLSTVRKWVIKVYYIRSNELIVFSVITACKMHMLKERIRVIKLAKKRLLSSTRIEKSYREKLNEYNIL